MTAPRKQIPPERRLFYYTGMGLVAIGLFLFVSVFFTATANFGNRSFGNFEDFDAQARSQGFRAIGGMLLIFAGAFLMSIGTKGWAGSGVVLDPEQAREDVEPWSRMAGGVVQDALSEVEVVKKLGDRLDPAPPQIKVRCKKCQSLNDESAKFCNQCGSSI